MDPTGAISPSFQVQRAVTEDAAAIARVHVESWREAYGRILPAAFLSRLSVDERTVGWSERLRLEATSAENPPHASFVVREADGTVTGFCNAGRNRGDPKELAGEIYAIYLLRDWTRRGRGRALFAAARDWLRAHDLEPTVIWVLAENLGARQFYQRLGGAELACKSIRIGGMDYSEIAYGFGWPIDQASL